MIAEPSGSAPASVVDSLQEKQKKKKHKKKINKKPPEIIQQHENFLACFVKEKDTAFDFSLAQTRALAILKSDTFNADDLFVLRALHALIMAASMEDGPQIQEINPELLDQLLMLPDIDWQKVLGLDLYSVCVHKYAFNPELSTISQVAIEAYQSTMLRAFIRKGARMNVGTRETMARNTLGLAMLGNYDRTSSEHVKALEIIDLLLEAHNAASLDKKFTDIQLQDAIMAASRYAYVEYIEMVLKKANPFNASGLVANLLREVMEYFIVDAISYGSIEPDRYYAIFNPKPESDITQTYECILAYCVSNPAYHDSLGELITQLRNCLTALHQLSDLLSRGLTYPKEASTRDKKKLRDLMRELDARSCQTIIPFFEAFKKRVIATRNFLTIEHELGLSGECAPLVPTPKPPSKFREEKKTTLLFSNVFVSTDSDKTKVIKPADPVVSPKKTTEVASYDL